MSELYDSSNPYRAPGVAEAQPVRARDPLRAAKFLGAAVAVSAATAAIIVVTRSSLPGVFGFGAASLLALAGFIAGAIGFARARGVARLAQLFSAVLNLLMALSGALLAFVSLGGFVRGRQLRRFGRVVLPALASGEDWAGLRSEVAIHQGDARALATQWRENGRTEYASVAAFARLALDLAALGAPPELLATANRDALDEIRHAELCFSLARSLDGQSVRPAPFAEASRARARPRSRRLALAMLAVDSLIDGALHEGVSARIVAKLAKRCEVPAIRDALKEIAGDEGRHAAHGWAVALWCAREGGEPVVRALEGAAFTLAKTVHSPLPEAARDGAWERFGIHGHALEEEEYATTRADLVVRVTRLREKRAA